MSPFVKPPNLMKEIVVIKSSVLPSTGDFSFC